MDSYAERSVSVADLKFCVFKVRYEDSNSY
jgi:hypothetical protein